MEMNKKKGRKKNNLREAFFFFFISLQFIHRTAFLTIFFLVFYQFDANTLSLPSSVPLFVNKKTMLWINKDRKKKKKTIIHNKAQYVIGITKPFP
jgi:hypothetical protein